MSEARRALSAWVEANVVDVDQRRALSKLVAAYVAESVREKVEAVTEKHRREQSVAKAVGDLEGLVYRFGSMGARTQAPR